MFNMEKIKKESSEKQSQSFFDLEEEMKDRDKSSAIQEKIDQQIQRLNTILREGGNKDSFEQFQTLFLGYSALKKILNRINRKII